MMLKQYLVTLTAFLLIDGIWLMLIAKNFYAKYLGYLMTKTPNLWAAGLFYLIYAMGMVILIISPSLQKGSLMTAILTGALFGLCSYATYDLTNLATIRDWPILISIIDIIWGTVLSGAVAGISYLILSK